MHTPLALDKEVESYELEVVGIDRDGAPALIFPSVIALETGEFLEAPPGTGSVTTRVPRGTYVIDAFIDGVDASGRSTVSVLVQPGSRSRARPR